MKTIALTKGQSALVDDDDYEDLIQFKWCARMDPKNGSYYAERAVVLQLKPKLKTKSIKMHRYILGTIDPKIHVDHKDGNTLNNTKENLREATPTQNGGNRTTNNKNSSGFRGVCFKKRTGFDRHGNPHLFPKKEWVAQINMNGKRVGLGYFETAEEAARAFDKAAIEIYGEFCGKLNFEEPKKEEENGSTK